MKWLRILLWIAMVAALLVIILLAVFHFLLDRTNGEILSSGVQRRYLLYVPASYNPQVPAPLILSMHGYVEWPAHQMQISGWNKLADEFGFIVVYPSGTGFPRRWYDTGQSKAGEDPLVDVKFIADLIDRLEQEYAIDKTRIYANGLSNGGGMSIFLACTLSDRIAAVGSVSGAYLVPEYECLPTRPVPLIAFHGTADPIVPYHGGPSESFDIPFPDVPDWIANWAAGNGCDSLPQSIPAAGSVSGDLYLNCKQNAGVVFYTIDDGGHSWPGGQPLPEWLVGVTTQDVDATRVMWEFFQQHPLEN